VPTRIVEGRYPQLVAVMFFAGALKTIGREL